MSIHGYVCVIYVFSIPVYKEICYSFKLQLRFLHQFFHFLCESSAFAFHSWETKRQFGASSWRVLRCHNTPGTITNVWPHFTHPVCQFSFLVFFLVVHIEQPVLQLLPTNILMEISSFSVLLKKSPMRPYPWIMTHSIRKQKRFCQSFKSRISYGCNEYPNGPFWAPVLLLTSFQRQ